jgi:hypothetical protein
MKLIKGGPGRYGTPDGRFTVIRKDHPLLGGSGSRATWIVTDTSGALPFRDSLGGAVAEYWCGTLAEARAAIEEVAS